MLQRSITLNYSHTLVHVIQARDRIDTLIEQLEVESKRVTLKKIMQQSHIFQLHGCTKQMENSENLGLCFPV
ncbi:hypothetical protein ACJX0J_015945, partial [Zea mays]